MIVAYMRVSTNDQTIENQREQFKRKGFEIEKEYTDEGLSGKDFDRPGFKAMYDFVREGDTLVVYSLSRLGRSTIELLKVIEELDKRKVKLFSLTENIDTGSATGKLLVGLLAVLAEFERNTLLERQRAGIERAKKEGKYKGRKKIEKPWNWDEVIAKWKMRELTGTKAMEILGMKRTTFYKMLEEEKPGT